MDETLLEDKIKGKKPLDENEVPECVKKYGYKDTDPYQTANCFSSLFFYWAYRIIKLANLTPLRNKYLGKLKGPHESRNYLQEIKYIWEEKGYKFKKSMPLIKAGFRSNWKFVFVVLLFSLIRSGLSIAITTLFRQYMKLFKSQKELDKEPKDFLSHFTHLQIGIMYLGVRLFEILFSRKAGQAQQILGLKSGIEFNTLIFDKLLKVSPASMKDRARSGEIVNFMTVDAFKLQRLMQTSPDLLTMPMQIVVYSYMLFQFFGFSFFFGLGTMIFFMFINLIFHRKFKAFQKKQMKLKDKRMKILTETFNNIKILKLYNWEDEFLRRITVAREDEINNLAARFRVSNINQTLGYLAPILTSCASIGAYQYFNDTLKIEDIFTCLGIFTSLQWPLRSLPMIVNSWYETTISMARISKYLLEDEINEKNLIRDDKETKAKDIMIKIQNGNFTWGVAAKEQENYLDDKEMPFGRGSKGKKKGKGKMPPDPDSQRSSYGPIELSSSITSDDTLPSKYSSISNDPEKLVNDINDIGPFGITKSVLKNINLEVKKGEFLCIIGEVGSGKSSLLQAMLNNMLPVNYDTKIILNGSVSYVSQIPWIQNATVRDNVIFYQHFDEKKYDKVLDLCELKPDLDILIGGDLTEIGEKGVNLSGGQKARITLARALYADKDIYIFDDPISALDAHVGMNVMKNCIIEHLKGKTRILVTHALQYVHYADRIIYLKDGEIAWEGTYKEIKQQDFFSVFYDKMKTLNRKTSKEIEEMQNALEEELANNQTEKVNEGKIKRITVDEDKEKGKVSADVYKAYFRYIGAWKTAFLLAFLLIAIQGLKSASDVWLGWWTENQQKNKNTMYFIIFTGLGLTSTLFAYFRVAYNSRCSIHISRTIHKEMLESLIRAPICSFHETVPKGVIFNRLSKDVNNLDAWSMREFSELCNCLMSFICSLCICSYYQPFCLGFLPVFVFVGYKLAVFYVTCSRELSRIEGIARSPSLNLLNETIPGTVTIRAFNYQKRYMEMMFERLDEHQKVRIIMNGTNCWFDLVLDMISFGFIAFLIGFTITFKEKFSASIIGLLLTYSVNLQTSIFHGLHITTGFENSMVGLERCLGFTKCPSEKPKDMAVDQVLSTWPSEGRIKFENFSVKYREDTEIVLKDINFETGPNEKIGIVGRTGSGKSTISLCLFRIIEPLTGKISIDGVDISTLGLGKLRSNLTIIPQDPSLMEGTLRYNIDPLNQFTDAEIMEVMKKINFDYIVHNNAEGINQMITEGGSNLSVGEKQLICIVRAILRRSKIIIMDEATASIDYQTEEIIQKAINEILKDSTVLTIAHRIKTIINCSRIIALENGEIVDFDTPKNLLDKKEGLFYDLYTKSTL
ncbi:MAG: ATP-binding cassette domain-containing protein [archaeon]|nr:ATP-binding cassette domain-containing protein [archaeon]